MTRRIVKMAPTQALNLSFPVYRVRHEQKTPKVPSGSDILYCPFIQYLQRT